MFPDSTEPTRLVNPDRCPLTWLMIGRPGVGSPTETEESFMASPWPIFRCREDGVPLDPHDGIAWLPPPPPWRRFDDAPEVCPEPEPILKPPPPHLFDPEEVELINAAMFLRRPLLITGPPGCGKSTLTRALAYQLKLGQVLRWPINTRSTLHEGLYQYDAVGRLQDLGVDRLRSPR